MRHLYLAPLKSADCVCKVQQLILKVHRNCGTRKDELQPASTIETFQILTTALYSFCQITYERSRRQWVRTGRDLTVEPPEQQAQRERAGPEAGDN